MASFSASSDQVAFLSSELSVTDSKHRQASKLSIGKNKTIITSFGNHQIVQFNLSPLLVTLVAAPTANTGNYSFFFFVLLLFVLQLTRRACVAVGILLDVGVDLQTILQPAAAAIQEIAASK